MLRSQQIHRRVMAWPGVEAAPHRFGGIEYRLGRREIGHVHGESLVDVPLPRRLRDELIASGGARPHHLLPDSGWVSAPLQRTDGVGAALEILRRSYEIARKQLEARRG